MFERKIAALAGLALGITACSSPRGAESGPPPEPELKILHLYATPDTITKGSSATLCYGVDNASIVMVDPPVTQLSPALNRCFSVMPNRTTIYKLTASGTGGAEISRRVTVKVEGGVDGSVILFFTASQREIPSSQSVTLCYGAPRARSVHLSPGNQALPSGEKYCIQQPVQTTTMFTLTAVGPNGEQQKETLTVKVGR
jgi:hypothetical protein